jgi:hypothetical protein
MREVTERFPRTQDSIPGTWCLGRDHRSNVLHRD